MLTSMGMFAAKPDSTILATTVPRIADGSIASAALAGMADPLPHFCCVLNCLGKVFKYIEFKIILFARC
jgi:hypothetical protein